MDRGRDRAMDVDMDRGISIRIGRVLDRGVERDE
jgi:hypothetical protein